MSSEQRDGQHPMFDKIERAAVVEEPHPKPEVQGNPEARAEELFALWQDFRRASIDSHIKRRKYKKEHPTEEFNDPNGDKLNKVRSALSERWSDPAVQALFKKRVGEAAVEWGKIKKPLKEYKTIQSGLQASQADLEKLYREVFEHRGKDPDELTQIQIAELSAQADSQKNQVEAMEQSSPELSAQLSFERLKDYQKQLSRDGFIWTASREKYFEKIIDHLVVVNQNRPLLLAGETGTGKTRLARAVSKRLTGKNPYEVGEEAKTDIRPLLGSRAIDEKGSYINYGQLGQALSGKETSRDTKPGAGGIFYMDEMNGYPGDALRSLVKQISGRRPGEEITFAAWAGQKEKLSQDFGFLGSANLPSEKHPDRADLPVEVARELGSLEIDYPPQSAEDPELYEMMLAGLMDQNGRIRVPQEALAPEYEDVVDAATKEKHKRLKTEPESGGALWRFANLVADVQKSYKGQDNALTSTLRDASHLRAAVLDPGLVLSWLAAYRKAAMRRNVDLQTFLGEKLETWAGQKIYPEEDRNLLKQFVVKFNLETPDRPVNHKQTILSPAEIGRLSPRVPREAQIMENEARPTEAMAILENGTQVLYNLESKNPASGSRVVKKGDRSRQTFVFKGFVIGEPRDHALIESSTGKLETVSPSDFARNWEAASLGFSEKFEGREIKLDVLEARAKSEKFYKEHNLSEFAANLPKDIRFSPDSEAKIREALKMGFDRAMVLPATSVQGQYQDKLLTEMQAGYATADQFWSEKPKTVATRNRPAKAYLFLYSSGAIPQETKNLNQTQTEALFRQKHWNGLTLAEFRLTERLHFEADGNHNFHSWNNDAKLSNWTRLLDSADASGAAAARWNPDNSRVYFYWRDPASVHPRLGARPAVVVEIL